MQNYLDELARRAALPRGFECATASLEFYAAEKKTAHPLKMNLALLALKDRPCTRFAGVFTQNSFPGVPVRLARRQMQGKSLRAVIINNKIANDYTREGEERALRLAAATAGQLGCRPEEVISVSTGIIGWELPIDEMCQKLAPLCAGFSDASSLPVAKAIMTTDTFPKLRRAEVGGGVILAIAKGAGMIEPNLSTMLCFILTDVALPKPTLQKALKRAVDRSFNAISIDGDQSPSDMALLLSSGLTGGVAEKEFCQALDTVLGALAQDIVRNGEGTNHVIQVTVSGAPDEATARQTGKALINSPLVKTAIYGNDPNVGRLLSCMGDYLGNQGIRLTEKRVSIQIGGITVCRHGLFEIDQNVEKKLNAYLADCALLSPAVGTQAGQVPFLKAPGYPLHSRKVEIAIDLGRGTKSFTVYGSDLSYDYVRVNAEYRS